MNPWLALLPALTVFTLGAFLSYHKPSREAWWFVPLLGLLSLTSGMLWAWAARRLPSDRELYAFGLFWDVAVIAAYSVLPLAAFGVRLSPAAWLGFCLVLLGTCLVKWA